MSEKPCDHFTPIVDEDSYEEYNGIVMPADDAVVVRIMEELEWY